MVRIEQHTTGGERERVTTLVDNTAEVIMVGGRLVVTTVGATKGKKKHSFWVTMSPDEIVKVIDFINGLGAYQSAIRHTTSQVERLLAEKVSH